MESKVIRLQLLTLSGKKRIELNQRIKTFRLYFAAEVEHSEQKQNCCFPEVSDCWEGI